MIDEIPIVASHQQRLEPPPVCPPDQEPAAVQPPAPPTPEQARAVEAAFSRREENASVAGILGLWTSAMVLNDLLQDASEELDRPVGAPKRKPGRDTH